MAKDDLREILEGIAGDSPDTAECLRLEFREKLDAVGRNPGIGHYHDVILTESG